MMLLAHLLELEQVVLQVLLNLMLVEIHLIEVLAEVVELELQVETLQLMELAVLVVMVCQYQ